MYICGRKVKIVTGAKSQTINICTSANVPGKYDYRVRLGPPFISEATLSLERFASIDDVVHFLEGSHNGQVEQSPAMAVLLASETAGAPSPSLPGTGRIQSEFFAWRDAWDTLSSNGNIADVLELWHAPVPDPWMRLEADTPDRLLSGLRYTRGNLTGSRRGEHEVEDDILIRRFATVSCLDQPLLDGINAFPLVKDYGGGRRGNVEADLVLLIGHPNLAGILVCDVKITDGDPWQALLQNLRQLRLFTSNPCCASIFKHRGLDAKIAQIRGGVIAPESFYSRSGARDCLLRARSLSDSISKPPHDVRAQLLVWDAATARLARRE
jgi:hypothetical protein